MSTVTKTRSRAAWGLAFILAPLFMQSPLSAAEPIRIVILSGANVHDWKATTPFIEKMYNESGRFKVVGVVDDVTKVTAATFANCDVIVSNWTCHNVMTGGPWTPEGKQAFADAIRSGKGMVSFHAASAACNDWPEFQEISGLTWKLGHTGHTAYHTFKVVIGDTPHPITEGMSDFWITDELYQEMVKMSKSDFRLHAKAFAEPDWGGTGQWEPVLITTQLGKGRGVNFLLGHDVATMRNIAWQTIMLRGTEWAATGKVTIPIPKDWPTNAAAATIVGMDTGAAMKAAAEYAFGRSRQPLFVVEQLVIDASSRTGEAGAAHRSKLAARLGEMIESCKTPEAKAFFCKQLAMIGTREQVPIVAPLLADERTATMARFALERIPGPQAAAALREALPKLNGRLKVGVINSIGDRADTAAVDALVPLLKDADPEIASAAAAALGKIGGDEATGALERVLGEATGERRAVAAEANLRCADRALTSIPAPPSKGAKPAFTWRQTDGVLALVNGDHVVWQFNYGKDLSRPYFYPLNLADGTELTWLAPPDHPHHRAFWFAWKDINGVDYWAEPTPVAPGGKTEVVRFEATPQGDFSARMEMEISYHEAGKPPVLSEKRLIAITAPDKNGGYVIDWESTFTAADKDVHFKGGTAGGGYSGLSVRLAKDSRYWRLIASEGRQDGDCGGVTKNTHGQRARWADLSFAPGTGQPAGIAIFDHPSNLRYPSQWHDIVDGRMPFVYFSPAPLWSEPYTLPAAKSMTLKYRVVVHAGRMEPARIEAMWKTWTEAAR